MLMIFPELLAFSLFAPLILRLAAGAAFIVLGAKYFGKNTLAAREELNRVLPWASSFAILIAIAEFAIGALLIVGLSTQVVAILAGIGALKLAYFRHRFSFRTVAPFSISTCILLAAISLSLLLTGAGLFAFDLPL
jgi:uncharacterized membrane protein YphA (DoxX/SURF4 family)